MNFPKMRLAAVLKPNLPAGQGANAAAIVVGALRCGGFCDPIADLDGNLHAAIVFNLIVLQAKTPSQLQALAGKAKEGDIRYVIFTSQGQAISNDFGEYSRFVTGLTGGNIDLVAIGIYAEEEKIRDITKIFSVYKG